jgi:hypothetical protein
MFARNFSIITLTLFIAFTAALPASAVSGVLDFQVKDSLTHQPIQASVAGSGIQTFSVSTDSRGDARMTLPSGDYFLEVSAPGYASLRTHYAVENGKNTLGGAYLDPKTIPSEEARDVLDPLLKADYTLLHEYVVDAKTGDPISGVTVRFLNAAVETETDAKGHFTLSVLTPKPENPGGLGTDTLVYEKPGYQKLTLEGFGIAPEEMGPSVVELRRGTGAVKRDAMHKLMQPGEAPALAPQSAIPRINLPRNVYSWLGRNGTSFPAGSAASAKQNPQTVIIPNSIKVGHNCSVVNSQIVCTSWDPAISLETYVSNGLLGEWLSPWVDDSLKAGSVAYRSYGAWYVSHPLSSNYDICDNALCQVYNPSTFKPTKREQADVVATAGVVLSRDNVNIFKAEYAAESNLASDTQYATCPNGQVGEPSQSWPCMKDFVDTGKSQSNTHSRGMCQRGSQRWASGLDNTGAPGDTGQPILNSDGVPIMPRDWRCILDHYYNATSNSITVDPSGTGNPGAGSGLRTAFMQGQPAFGYTAYEALGSGRGTGIRAARTADGSADYQIVSAGNYPSWEPGGNRLVYTLGGTGTFVVNADGLNNHMIVAEGCGPGNECDFAASWSPLGDKIAFCSYRGASWHIWTVNPDGSQLQQIPTVISVQDASYEDESCYIRWSPDGRK